MPSAPRGRPPRGAARRAPRRRGCQNACARARAASHRWRAACRPPRRARRGRVRRWPPGRWRGRLLLHRKGQSR
eukprot:2908803-Pleurochrysis_carterae.AAC.2